MPELPEVQTVLNSLKKRIKGQQIKDINILWNNIIINDIDDFKSKLIGQHFNNFKRRGKYLLFELDDITLVSHLRMEGKYYILNFNEPITKHMHIIFKLDDFNLVYHDTRKFGRMEIINKSTNYDDFKNLGLEPFDNKLNTKYLKDKLINNHRPIKQTLLDQKIIAGIGNIYADEILFISNINPTKISNKLNDQQLQLIIDHSKKILSSAIKAGGTTIRSYNVDKIDGLFQLSLNVHMQKDKPCKICNTIIKKIKVNKRGTYYCEKCQK